MERYVASCLIAVCLLASASCGSQSGAVTLRNEFGFTYCSNNPDEARAEAHAMGAEIVSSSPGRSCDDLGFTKPCPQNLPSYYDVPEFKC
jgi:hypothetical protein